MTTITIKINERTKAGKTLRNLIDIFSKEKNGVEIISEKDNYNEEFVEKILNSHKNDKRVIIETDKLWESI
ncbi:DUF2683 family protein [Chryseobacterium foetidum]|uniref:DUF2683 family protein n=1 Tax=Chryseobacterium foetidum TaxID=2951057 RepID=UPI0021C6A503|nr:DUF2683 family protein [Chryseobacterium foetidum]